MAQVCQVIADAMGMDNKLPISNALADKFIEENGEPPTAMSELPNNQEPPNGGLDQRLVLCNRWRRLANSWLSATANIPRGDHVRDNAETRAQAYQDCAEELTALIQSENA